MLNLLPSVIALGVAALAALYFTRTRQYPALRQEQLNLASRALAAATAIQAVHFAEEALTGFHQRFPAIFGLEEIPFSGFVTFNLLCLAFWAASIPGIRAARAYALFAAWFLAIAGVLNGVAHPLLAVAVGGYFPGLFTSPLIAVAAALLWRNLINASTAAQEPSPPHL